MRDVTEAIRGLLGLPSGFYQLSAGIGQANTASGGTLGRHRFPLSPVREPMAGPDRWPTRHHSTAGAF